MDLQKLVLRNEKKVDMACRKSIISKYEQGAKTMVSHAQLKLGMEGSSKHLILFQISMKLPSAKNDLGPVLNRFGKRFHF